MLITHAKLIGLIEKQVKELGTQKAVALKYGISQQYLNDILQHKRLPGKKLLTAMGYEHVHAYRRRVSSWSREIEKNI